MVQTLTVEAGKGRLTSLIVWDDPERAFALQAINREISPVERKDRADPLALGKMHQRTIRQLRLDASVATHETLD
jgi:hypothetical protein